MRRSPRWFMLGAYHSSGNISRKLPAMVRLFGFDATLLLAAAVVAALVLPAGAQEQRPPGWKMPPGLEAPAPCPPRRPGEPRPTNCVDPCPQGMIGQHPNCSCPPGTVLAERPASPSERCVKPAPAPPMAVEHPSGMKLPDLMKKCPEEQIGTYPDCRCPPGLMGPKCDQPIVK